MKSGYAIIVGIFLSVSAIVFFNGEARILQFISGKEATAPKKDSTVQKKKLPAKSASKIKVKKSGLPSQTVDLPSYLFLPNISAIKTVDKTAGAVSGDVLNYTVTISNTGTADATGLTFTDNIDPNTTLVPGSLKTSPIAFNDAYTALGNVGISVPAANGILANDELGTNLPATFAAVTNAATAQGGTISINSDGSLHTGSRFCRR
jgi:trimeric autotransporter adhesin